MRGFALLLIFVSSVASAQIKNQKLGDVTAPAGGTSVAVSPKNDKTILAYGGGKIKYSIDLGATWQESGLTLPSDILETPVVTCDAKGNFYIFYTSANQLTTNHSTDNGKTWSEPILVAPAIKNVQYNPGVSTHGKKEELLVSWTEVEELGSNADSCKSVIRMSSSGNGGKKWSEPILVNQNTGNCMDEDFTVRASNPMIAFDNKRFITWASQGAMFYDRSYDGEFWISTDLAISEQAGGWTMSVPGFGKVANLPSFTGDNSPSRMHGTLFLTYSDFKSGETDADVWLIRSVSRGDSWTNAARINQDKPGHMQFLPKLAIDQANGHVYIGYYDRRDSTDNQTNVYIAWSTDGGNQFKEKKVTEKPFVADQDAKDYMTNYISLAVNKGMIVLTWTENKEIKAAVMKPEDLR